ncbi:MAG: Ger(x)C family spore germination protein [Mycobacterium leprae]
MRKTTTVILLLLSLTLTGCWDLTALEDAGFVSAMGIDLATDEAGGYIWTYVLPKTEQLNVGVLSPPGGVRTYPAAEVVVRADTLQQSVEMVQASMGRILTLEHLRFVVFGEDLARAGLAPVVSMLMRHNQVRRGVGASVSVGPALETMKIFAPVLDVNPVKVEEGILLAEKRMHLSPPTRLQHLYARLLSLGQDAILSMEVGNKEATEPATTAPPPPTRRSFMAGQFPRHGGNPVEFAGTAVFRGDKLVGYLTVDETVILLALRGEMGKVYQTVPDPKTPGKWISIRFGQENKPRIRTSFVNGRPVVQIQLQMEGEVLSTPTRTSYAIPENRRLLEDHVASWADANLYGPLVQKLYGEWHTDPVGLGQRFRHFFPTFTAWEAYDWPSHIKDVQVTVKSSMFIRRFGLLMQETGGPNRR